MQHHLKNFYTKLAFKKFGKMSQLILQFRKKGINYYMKCGKIIYHHNKNRFYLQKLY